MHTSLATSICTYNSLSQLPKQSRLLHSQQQ
jgi:hypothetical protein